MAKRGQTVESKTPSPFKIKSTQPDAISPAEFVESFDLVVENLKKMELTHRGKRVVEVQVAHSDPIQVIFAGDLHLGSIATNKKMCDDLKQYLLDNPNAVLVLMGDEIEGFKARYATTNTATSVPNLQSQIDYFYYSFFEPLANAGKIAAVVSGYWGHPGWAHDDTTLNIWAIMTRNRTDVPLIANGGELKIRFKNGQINKTQVFHNPPGSSRIDPVHGLRNAAQSQNPADRPSNFAAGHLHRAMVTTEHHPDLEGPTNYIQAGTPKGSVEGDNTDAFGEKLGLSYTNPWLQGVVLRPRKGRSRKQNPEIQYPFISATQGQLVHAALELLDTTEKSGLTADVLGQIHEAYPQPTVTYKPRRSKVTSSPAEMLNSLEPHVRTKKEGDKITQSEIRPLYQAVAYDIQTRLPITVHAVSNTRLGSWHEQKGTLPIEQFHQTISEDPYAFAVYLRSIIDSNTATQPNRLEILQQYIDLVNLMDQRALGVLLDGALGHKSWLKRLGDEDHLRPIAAGSHLSAETSAKLIHHMSLINLAVGPGGNNQTKTIYSMQAVDRLMRHGSFSSTKGIKRMYDLYAASRPSVIMGGHMPVSGVSQFYDMTNLYTDTPITLSPGWWAQFTDTTGTRSKGGKPGQAVILLPGSAQSEAMMIPTSSADETEYLARAITLHEGAAALGILDQLKTGQRKR